MRFFKMEFIAIALPVTVILLFWLMAMASREGRAIGLVDGQLARCSAKPNCVCSEYPDDSNHYVEPLVIPARIENSERLHQLIKIVLEEVGGNIQIQSNTYIAATFESRFLGFIDDVEVRIDMPRQRVYLRSASRIGYSDMGANLKRVNRITELLKKRIPSLKVF